MTISKISVEYDGGSYREKDNSYDTGGGIDVYCNGMRGGLGGRQRSGRRRHDCTEHGITGHGVRRNGYIIGHADRKR